MNFQDPASIVMEGIIDLHHHIIFYLIIILWFVVWMLLAIVYEYGSGLYFYNSRFGREVGYILFARRENMRVRDIQHGEVIEIVWTIVPAIILILIAVPSFALLYSTEELMEPSLTLKVIGHQWYWSYEYSDMGGEINFDSYMLPLEDLKQGQLRLLEVDRKVWLPIGEEIRVIVSSSDVLHCWAVPSLGVKCDAVPGRLNQVKIFLKREGLFYGQCSELCGVNHGFMPICVRGVSVEEFLLWKNLVE